MSFGKDEIINALKSMSYLELVEIFYTASAKFREEDFGPDGSKKIYIAPVVAQTAFYYEEGPYDINLVCLPNRGSGVYVSDSVSQSGVCGTCKNLCSGFSKSSLCPVCGSDVGMT